MFKKIRQLNNKVDEKIEKQSKNINLQRTVYLGILIFFVASTLYLVLHKKNNNVHSSSKNISVSSTNTTSNTNSNNNDLTVKSISEQVGWADEHKDIPTYPHTFAGAVSTAYAYDVLIPQLGGWDIPTYARMLDIMVDKSVYVNAGYSTSFDAASYAINSLKNDLHVPSGATDMGQASTVWKPVMYKSWEVSDDRVHLYIMDNNEDTFYNGDKQMGCRIKDFDMHYVGNRWVVFSSYISKEVTIDYADTIADKDQNKIVPNSEQVRKAGWKIIGE